MQLQLRYKSPRLSIHKVIPLNLSFLEILELPLELPSTERLNGEKDSG